MSRSLTNKLMHAGATFALVTSLAALAAAAPTQIRFLDVDSASYNSFVGIYGAGFGDEKGSGQATFGGATSIQVAHWSDELIIARVPAGAQAGFVSVTTDTGDEVQSPTQLNIHTGTIYYVSTAGNDSGPGDESTPFQSLHKALSMAQPGDTVLIRAGTYDEQDLNSVPLPAMYFRPGDGGTSVKPITWRGYGSEVPVIRATQNLAKDSPVLFVDGEYLRLARLEINGANNTASAVSVWASNTWIVGLDIHSFGETGITVGETSSAVIAGNRIHEGGTRPSLDHGILMLGTSGTIRNNEIHDLPNGYGIFLEYQTQGSTNVFSNYVRNVAGGGIGLSRVQGGNRIYNNIVWNAGMSQGCRCALQVAYGEAAGETASPDRIYYNTFVGPSFTGMFMADRDGTVEMHGNIFSDFRVGIRVDDDASKTSLSSSHNLWYGGDEPPEFKWGGPWLEYSDFRAQSQQESSSLLTNPQFVSAQVGNFHLTSLSPAVDSGGGPDTPSVDYDGVERPLGSGPDLGAYEYTGQAGSGGSGGTGGAGGSDVGGSGGAAGGTAGMAGTGGDAGTGGGTSGSGGTSDAGTQDGDSASSDDEGCGCSTPGSRTGTPLVLLLGFAALLFGRRRR